MLKVRACSRMAVKANKYKINCDLATRLSNPVFCQSNLLGRQARRAFSATQMTVREGLNLAMCEEMERDQNVFLMGEEVAQYDGAYKITAGMLKKFGPKRVIDTHITEMGFTGMAVGAAMNGLRPICEFMSFNFSLQAIDQIVNSAAKACYMSGGRISVPVVFRGPNGAAKGVAAQHSQDLTPWYSSVPGLKVLTVFDSEDALGMVRAAVRDPNPTILLENELTYSLKFPVSDEVLDPEYALPFGRAKICREGKDLTIVTYSRMVAEALKAAETLAGEGVEAEVINLRSIRPLDREAIFRSVAKTNRLVTVEEGWHHCGLGAEICGLIMDTSAFYQLDAPVERVTGADVPMPYAAGLEALCTPTHTEVLAACRRALHVRD